MLNDERNGGGAPSGRAEGLGRYDEGSERGRPYELRFKVRAFVRAHAAVLGGTVA